MVARNNRAIAPHPDRHVHQHGGCYVKRAPRTLLDSRRAERVPQGVQPCPQRAQLKGEPRAPGGTLDVESNPVWLLNTPLGHTILAQTPYLSFRRSPG